MLQWHVSGGMVSIMVLLVHDIAGLTLFAQRANTLPNVCDNTVTTDSAYIVSTLTED